MVYVSTSKPEMLESTADIGLGTSYVQENFTFHTHILSHHMRIALAKITALFMEGFIFLRYFMRYISGSGVSLCSY